MTKTNSTPPPEKLKQSKLAQHFEVSSRRIRTLETEGYFERDEDGFYSVREVAMVFANMDPDRRVSGQVTNEKRPSESAESAPWNGEGEVPALALSKARKEAFAAEITRAKAQKLIGELIPRSEVEASLEAIGSEVMVGMKNLAPKLKPHLTEDGRALIDKAVDATLRDIGRKLEKLLEDQDKATGAEA